MEWRDQGFLLSARPHGESAAIIEVFTPEYGRHLGVNLLPFYNLERSWISLGARA